MFFYAKYYMFIYWKTHSIISASERSLSRRVWIVSEIVHRIEGVAVPIFGRVVFAPKSENYQKLFNDGQTRSRSTKFSKSFLNFSVSDDFFFSRHLTFYAISDHKYRMHFELVIMILKRLTKCLCSPVLYKYTRKADHKLVQKW
jgi:hypothetical protein